jgi:serine/threonine protein kinase
MSPIGPGHSLAGGSYRLLSSIGLGGFGEVFLAEGPDGLVAVKAVETAGWSPREYEVFNAMMLSEASFLSTLDHPALPKLRAFFAESSRYYLVMDWVSGRTLEELVAEQGPLPLREAMDMLGQLLRVLDYLHGDCRPPVVFGDLKPANVLRTFDGAYRLVDLGLATREGACLTGGFAVYSPPFGAPELASGQPSSRGHDIYSLSATVLFAIQGGPPRPGRQADLDKLLDSHSPVRGQEAWQRLGQLLTLLLAALGPQPEGRPTSLEPLCQAWQRWDNAQRAEDRKEAGQSCPESIMRALYGTSEGR